MEMKISVLLSIELKMRLRWAITLLFPVQNPKSGNLISLHYTGNLHTCAHRTSTSQNSAPRGRTEYVFKRGEEKGVQAMPPPPSLRAFPRLTSQVTHSTSMEQSKECGKRQVFWENLSS